MEKNSRIYATNGIIIEVYNLSLGERIIEVKARIDKWNSDVIAKETSKREAISSDDDDDFENLGYGEYDYGDDETVYRSETHPLSFLCEDLLKTDNPIEMSQWFKILLTWTPDNSEEAKLLCELLRSIQIKRMNTPHSTKVNYLRRVLDLLTNNPNSPRVLYNRDLQERIEYMESEHNILLDTPSDMRFRFKHPDILKIKSRTFKSLPRIKDIDDNYENNNK